MERLLRRMRLWGKNCFSGAVFGLRRTGRGGRDYSPEFARELGGRDYWVVLRFGFGFGLDLFSGLRGSLGSGQQS
jgi:hypothetical protein